MNLDFYIARLSANAETIKSLVGNLSDEQIFWKNDLEKWSILQIVFHLRQTERKDFRLRLEKTLRDESEEWTPFVPEETHLAQDVNTGNNLAELLKDFLAEREKSVAWLKTLRNPNFQNAHRHNESKLSAGDLLASWLAHDFLHIKQIVRLHYDYVNHISQPFETVYAGEWT